MPVCDRPASTLSQELESGFRMNCYTNKISGAQLIQTERIGLKSRHHDYRTNL
jgi:hypothetical protein